MTTVRLPPSASKLRGNWGLSTTKAASAFSGSWRMSASSTTPRSSVADRERARAGRPRSKSRIGERCHAGEQPGPAEGERARARGEERVRAVRRREPDQERRAHGGLAIARGGIGLDGRAQEAAEREGEERAPREERVAELAHDEIEGRVARRLLHEREAEQPREGRLGPRRGESTATPKPSAARPAASAAPPITSRAPKGCCRSAAPARRSTQVEPDRRAPARPRRAGAPATGSPRRAPTSPTTRATRCARERPVAAVEQRAGEPGERHRERRHRDDVAEHGARLHEEQRHRHERDDAVERRRAGRRGARGTRRARRRPRGPTARAAAAPSSRAGRRA